MSKINKILFVIIPFFLSFTSAFSLINFPHSNEETIKLLQIHRFDTLPFSINKNASPSVFKMNFTYKYYPDPVIFIDKFTFFDRFDIYNGSDLFYSSYKGFTESEYRFLPARFHLIPKKVNGPEHFYLIIHSEDTTQTRINDPEGIMLCSYNATINKLYLSSMENFLIGVVCIAIGFFTLILYMFNKKRKEKLNLAFGMMAFINGLYIALYNFIGLHYISSPIIWWYISYFAYFWIPVTIFYAIEQSLLGQMSKYITYFKYIFVLFSIVALVLDVLKIESLYFIDNKYFYLALGATTLFTSSNLILCWIKGSKDARFISISFIIFGIFSFIDILDGLGIIHHSFGYFPIGLLVFFIFMLIFVEMKFNESQNKIVEYSEQLEDLNKNLEQKVDKRTQELNESNHRISEQNLELEELITQLSDKNQQISLQNSELELLLDDLSLKKIEIEDSNEKLKELINTKDKFFSIIAHDLKNPLSSIIMSSEITFTYYDRFTTEEQIKHIKKQYESAQNLSQLLENLLTWARSQTGAISYNPLKLNLIEIINENLNLLENSFNRKSINYHFLNKGDSFVYADVNMIKTVIRNLLTNAIKFTKIDGKIEILLKENELEVQIEIKDDGIGMNVETLNKLFQIESKISQKGTLGESGTGLGLILCHEFIQKHNGKIWADSEAGYGSTFYIILPRVV